MSWFYLCCGAGAFFIRDDNADSSYAGVFLILLNQYGDFLSVTKHLYDWHFAIEAVALWLFTGLVSPVGNGGGSKIKTARDSFLVKFAGRLKVFIVQALDFARQSQSPRGLS
ncbi:hypothetical protein [Thalassomonas actiniarum]|uniref:Uncharacterized protein n=1 Tax=Thalassomonas actiniarum TaxID=485447 RepID=A0AAE9YRM4_9GAMM|nr:hypothetical protein [Thalassomonas actiniarum]WDD99964.1 hypothetical protein SG35_004695 [Thalassomonas actiniarum]